MTGARLGRLALGAVALVSGTYVFVYLVRWEWDRATVSALVFLASEVLLATSVVAGRLHRLEAELARRPDPAVLARLAQTRPPPRVTFAWLDPRQDRAPVLVPVLMGAGVVLGAVAFVVERLGRATAGPVAERGLARQLSVLALPPGGLLAPVDDLDHPDVRRPGRGLAGAASALVVVALLGAGVTALADRLQTRPDVVVPASSTVEMTVQGRRTAATPEQIAGTLWASCRATVPARTAGRVEVLDEARGRVRLTLTPGLGTYAARRLRGCLGDLRVERELAQDVVVRAGAGGG